MLGTIYLAVEEDWRVMTFLLLLASVIKSSCVASRRETGGQPGMRSCLQSGRCDLLVGKGKNKHIVSSVSIGARHAC